jgi:hypothetical protein
MERRIYSFDELDSTGEIVDAINRLENNLANEVEALQTEVERINDKITKKNRKKGFVMKNTLIGIAVMALIGGLLFTVARAAYTKSDIDYDIVSNPETLTQLLEDVINTGIFQFDPQSEPSDVTEGDVYYDSSSNALFLSTDGSTWTELAASTSGSLDGAYNNGHAIDVDGTAVTLTVSVGDDNACLIIDQDDTTNDPDALVIDNESDAATAVSLQIDSAAGYDIQGTGDVWNIEDSGIGNFVGLVTTTGDVTFTGTNYNIIHDASADQLEFQDAAKLSFGTNDDISIAFDNAGDDLDILGDDSEISWGVDGAGMDTIWHLETASTYIMVDEDADELLLVLADLKISQGSQIEFIDVTDSLVDWTIDNATDETLLIKPTETTDDQSINLGDATNTTDLRIFGKTASTVVYDASADIVIFDAYDVRMGDGDLINFGDSADFSMTATNTAMTMGSLTTDETSAWNFGADQDGDDVKVFGATTGASILWDASEDKLIVETADIQVMDGDFITFGDGLDFTIDSSTAKQLDIAPAGADELYSVHIGIDQSGVDLSLHGTTAGDILLWDASDDYLHMIGDKVLFTLAEAAQQFQVDATGTVVGNAIVLSTTDGGIYLDADGAGNGDILLNAADDMTLTAAGNLSIAVTGTTTVDNMTTFTIGYQSTPFDATADDADGAGNSIPAGTSVCEITAVTNNANDWVALPVGVLGEKITIIATVACELRTLDATDDEINEVDSDGTQEYQLTAGDIVECICVEAGARWTANSHTILGAAKTIVPD